MHQRSAAICDYVLGSLSTLLTKAEAHCTAKGIQPEALLTFWQFTDMPPFVRQVQLACDFAARAAAGRAAKRRAQRMSGECAVHRHGAVTRPALQAEVGAGRRLSAEAVRPAIIDTTTSTTASAP
ncbi:DUF1993 family protein [Paragemmobacter ruber]|uniref:DUF1993 family protein n=1 Tax=Paragemmobacter ruber TaxID=1985673 RepID=A0ABW9Y6E4_9RHOB|nr:DUF1993 family protein [Rhodobacter ruber]NBE07968.1 DUF1993 family protein [Rhodobacter ruber]